MAVVDMALPPSPPTREGQGILNELASQCIGVQAFHRGARKQMAGFRFGVWAPSHSSEVWEIRGQVRWPSSVSVLQRFDSIYTRKGRRHLK